MLIDTPRARTAVAREAGKATEREVEAPLSPLQAGMLYHSLSARHAGVYLQQLLIHWRAPLDLEALARAWEIAQESYDILRAAFRLSEEGEPRQVFQRRVELPTAFFDWTALSQSEREARLDELLAEDRAREMPLDIAPLQRWKNIRLGPDEYYLLWTSHHAIMDGRSRQLLLRDLFALHDRIAAGERPPAAPAPSYAEYIAWLETLDESAAENYWRTLLRGFTTPTPLPLQDGTGEPASGIEANRECSEWLGPVRTAALREFAAANRLTLNTLVQGAWGILLGRYSGEQDVVFGATRACRKSAMNGLGEEMAGLFINTLPVRVNLRGDARVIDWLHDLRAQSYDTRPYEHTSLSRIQQWSDTPAGSSLFNTIVVFEGYDLRQSLAREDARWEQSEVRLFEQTNYHLTLSATAGDDLVLKLEYDPARYGEAGCRRMLGHLVTLLDSMRAHPERLLGELRMLTAPEYEQVVSVWNQTEIDWAAESDVVARVERLAREQPDDVAVEAGAEALSYAELNRRANRLAHFLLQNGAGKDVPVGIFLERSLNLAVSLLAILKAGSGYVPLDPAYPTERLRFMIEDAGMPLLLTTGVLRPALPDTTARVVDLNALAAHWSRYPVEDPPPAYAGDALAYQMYTSGSTGRPKGVMITRDGLKNHNLAMRQAFDLTPQDRVLQFSTICFDIAVEEIFPTWMAGAALVFRDEAMAFSANDFTRGAAEKGITILNLPTSFWREWVLAAGQQELRAPSSLRLVIVGGEKTSASAYAAWCAWAPENVRWINTYGPTEFTVSATMHEPSRKAGAGMEIPIGRPLPNTLAYVLDLAGHPAPVGVDGELYLGGVQAARGYWNRPELTAGKFVRASFPGGPDLLLYRTGDKVRYREDGQLEFRGRADSQVKIGGYRVEPDEIQAALCRLPDVEDSIVTVRVMPEGTKRLLGYVRLRPNAPAIADGALREQLRALLPEYMIPDVIAILEQFPHTPNGKIDMRALPMPADLISEAPREMGRTPGELRLQQIWQELFGMPFIGREEGFFHLGGNSLLALRFTVQFEKAFGKPLPLPLFFRTPTIAALGEFLEAGTGRAPSCLVPLQPEGGDAPFFCVHGAGGSCYWFNDLAVRVGKEQPFYGFESPALSADVAGPELDELVAVPRLAAAYVAEMRRVQPRGPYRIGGYSLGGILAYEMARQLVAAGEQVSLLVIIDSDSPAVLLSKWEKRAIFLWRFLTLGLDEKRNFLAEKWRWLRQLREERQVDRGVASVSHLDLVKEAHLRSVFPYRPEADPAYSGRILLFRASQPNLTSPLSNDRGWSALAPRGVDVVTIPGNHYTLFAADNLEVMACHLGAALKRDAEAARHGA
ncbi:MAG: amino acid adenylation domain-containing protein [Blastocatellia bacterium]